MKLSLSDKNSGLCKLSKLCFSFDQKKVELNNAAGHILSETNRMKSTQPFKTPRFCRLEAF